MVQRPAQSEHAAGAFVRQRRDAAVRSAARDAAAYDAAVRSAEERSRAAYDAAVRRVVAAPGDAALAAQLFAAEEDLVQAELAAYAAARGQQRAQAQQRARAQRGERSGPMEADARCAHDESGDTQPPAKRTGMSVSG